MTDCSFLYFVLTSIKILYISKATYSQNIVAQYPFYIYIYLHGVFRKKMFEYIFVRKNGNTIYIKFNHEGPNLDYSHGQINYI